MLAGIYVFVMSVSGSIIVFRNQLEDSGPVRSVEWLVDLHENLLFGMAGRAVNGVGAIGLTYGSAHRWSLLFDVLQLPAMQNIGKGLQLTKANGLLHWRCYRPHRTIRLLPKIPPTTLVENEHI